MIVATTEYKQHMFVKHGVDINWSCPKCEETFDKKVDLDKHRRDVHYEKINTICQYCDKVFEGIVPRLELKRIGHCNINTDITLLLKPFIN